MKRHCNEAEINAHKTKTLRENIECPLQWCSVGISRKMVKMRFPPTNLLDFNGFWPKNMLTLNIS